ncbi:hypothetical protein ACROYT_G024673, partial [Oculina patagonica]
MEKNISYINMNELDLEKLSKTELIKLVLSLKANQPRVYKPRPPIPTPRKSVKQRVQDYEENIIQPPPEFRDDYNKPIPMPRTKKIKPIPTPRAKVSNEFNFDDNIFDTTSNDQPLFKITEIGNTVNKKYNAYTNEFKIIVRKNFIGNKNDVFSVFEKLIEMTINKRQLKPNDRFRLVISNNELTHPISTKLLKVSDFKLNQLSEIINTLEYKEIDLENCKIIIQSIKIPAGKSRLYLSKQTVNRKQCIISIKNNDTICLARAIVTAYAK